MADAETEAEWERSKRIEEEKMKAAQALQNDQSKANMAYLDYSQIQRKGWTKDPDAIGLSVEKNANIAIITVISGVIMMMISNVTGLEIRDSVMVSTVIGMLNGIGAMLLVYGGICGITAFGCEVVYKIRDKKNFTSSFWTALIAILIIVGYLVIRIVIAK